MPLKSLSASAEIPRLSLVFVASHRPPDKRIWVCRIRHLKHSSLRTAVLMLGFTSQAKGGWGQSGWRSDWAKCVRNSPCRHATLESFSNMNFPDASTENNLRMLPALVL